MIALFDYDSFVYQSVYKICSIAQIKAWIRANKNREWMEKEIVTLTINRLANMADDLFTEIEETGIEIEAVEYYLTTCKNSFRKRIEPNYKANRERNRMTKWVNKVRAELLTMDFAKIHDEYEADDLIADRAKEIGHDKCIILTIDKDLKQISGVFYNYYRESKKDDQGNKIQGDRKGLEVVTPDEAELFFCEQMLVGDSVDNIKGVPGIGEKKAKFIKKDWLNVFRAYENKFGELASVEYSKNYELLRLGTKNRHL